MNRRNMLKEVAAVLVGGLVVACPGCDSNSTGSAGDPPKEVEVPPAAPKGNEVVLPPK